MSIEIGDEFQFYEQQLSVVGFLSTHPLPVTCKTQYGNIMRSSYETVEQLVQKQKDQEKEDSFNACFQRAMDQLK